MWLLLVNFILLGRLLEWEDEEGWIVLFVENLYVSKNGGMVLDGFF